MNVLNKNIVCVNLSKVDKRSEYGMYGNKTMSTHIRNIKKYGCSKIYIWNPSMEIVFLELNPTNDHKFHVFDDQMLISLMGMNHNSNIKLDRSNQLINSLVMVEPNRIKSQNDLKGNLKNMELSTIIDLRKSNISKAWFWIDTMDMFTFKMKGVPKLSPQKLLLDIVEDIKDISLVNESKISKNAPTLQSVNLDTDSILDKISNLGIESLTDSEKDYLNSLSK